MSWWQPYNFEKKRPLLENRARMIKYLRHFFDDREFIEVQTPHLQICPTIDAHIHAFSVGELYLHTSPEFDMKKLLVAGIPRIYQICHVFRDDISSPLHLPEFTEWYRAGANYHDLMDDCVDILRGVAKTLDIENYTHKGISSNPFGQWQKISVCEAFLQYADIDLFNYLYDLEGFSKIANKLGIRTIESDNWDDIFHAVMAKKIEPYLGIGVPTILYDYPVSMASLSRKKPEDERFAERFELYVCGIELANAFSELTDAAEQRVRYEAEMKLKQELYGKTYPADEEFFKALEYGMPQSAGIALGVDRLVMLACGADNIGEVMWC